MSRIGYKSCIACHDSSRGMDSLSPYGKSIFTQVSLSQEEKRFFQDKNQIHQQIKTRYAYLKKDEISRHFPMQLEYLAAFKPKKSSYKVLAGFGVSPKSKNSNKEESFLQRLYLTKLEVIKKISPGHELSLSRKRNIVGLRLDDHTYLTKSRNKMGITDLSTQIAYHFVNNFYELESRFFGPNFQEKKEESKEIGLGQMIKYSLGSFSFGLDSLFGKTKEINRLVLIPFLKINFSKKIVLLSEFAFTNRKIKNEGSRFNQKTVLAQLSFFPTDYLRLSVDYEHLSMESPFKERVSKYGLGSYFRISSRFQWQNNIKYTHKKNKIFVTQIIANVL